jgi:hypothetical protein
MFKVTANSSFSSSTQTSIKVSASAHIGLLPMFLHLGSQSACSHDFLFSGITFCHGHDVMPFVKGDQNLEKQDLLFNSDVTVCV